MSKRSKYTVRSEFKAIYDAVALPICTWRNFTARLRSGWSLEESLTVAPRANNPSPELEQRFTKLVVKEFMGIRSGHPNWRCKCDCGRTTMVSTYNPQSKRVRSCGCRVSEPRANRTTLSCKLPEGKDYRKAYQRHCLLGWDCDDAKSIPTLKRGIRYRKVAI